MSEINEAPDKQFSIQKLYTKDLSFESPNAPKVFTQKWEPTINLNMGTHITTLENALFEVVLSVTVTVKVAEITAYLVEVQQCGVFTAEGFSEQELSPLLGSYCPGILFPFAREVISDLVTKGGFPPMLLAPVNFDALYMQQLQQAQQAQQAQPTSFQSPEFTEPQSLN